MTQIRTILVSGSVPTVNQLALGDIAINTVDGKAYIKKYSGSIQTVIEIGSGITPISASYALTASYVNPLRQAVYISGSLNVTGSTIQIGNNTLLGNTILSGSIIISGSTTTPATPTIKIYGDMETNGVIKFDPVVKNIDTTISASYIYVSGSTNDLYFSQNGDGYNNVTRLRWLEGNLYTGLLNGGLITTASSTTFNISSGSGIIVNLNASLNANPYPTIQYVNWGNLNNQTLTYLTSSIQTFVGIDSSGSIIQQTTPWTDGQYNTSIQIGTVLHQNKSTINSRIAYPNVAYGYKQRTYDFIKAFGPLKLSGYTIFTSSSLGLEVGSGIAFADGRNYQNDPNNPSYITDPGTNISKIFRYYQSGSDFVQDTNGGLGYTVIDPANYNPGNSGSLQPVPGTGANRQWSIQRVFWYPNSATKGIVVYYGSSTYTSEIDAAANLPYEPFNEVENTKQNAIYLGAIIIRNNGDFTTSTSYRILPGGLFRASLGGGGGGGGGSTVSPFPYTGSAEITGSLNVIGPVSASSFTGSFTGSLFGTASYALTSSFAVSSSRTVSSSFASTASYVNNLYQAVTVGNITSTPSNENTLNVYPSFAGGTGEGGQILLAASGGLYTSASMLDVWQDQFRILKGTNIGGSTAAYLYMNLTNGNTQFTGAVTASAYSGLPNDYLYVTRNTSQTIGSGNWANRDVIFNNSVVSKGIAYNTSTGLASLTGGKVYRITARIAWNAAGLYTFQHACYDSSNNILGPIAEMVQSTNATYNISDGTMEFIYAPGSNIDIKIRTTNNVTALSGEYIRGDLNTQLIIQQIA